MTYTLVPNRNLTVVTSDFKVLTIAADNPNWKAIMEAIKQNDETRIVSLMSMKETVQNFTAYIDGAGGIEVRGDSVYYRTEKLYGEDVSRIIAFVKDGIPARGMVNFLERKLKNPSKHSVDSLYNFLENKGMPITPNGTFLGYKGLNGDFSSKNTGAEPLISGIRLPNGSIDNNVGQSLRMDRRFVCDNFNDACGPGLHVGSLEYALGWAGSEGRVVIVEVDPADVVSVPNSEHTKLRACAYKVVGEYTERLPNVYTDDYVRPNTDIQDTCDACQELREDCDCDRESCEDCGNYIEDCDCDDICDDCGHAGFKCACAVGPTKNIPNTDLEEGYNRGLADGRNHQKRLVYEEDRGRSFRKYSSTYVDGYLNGYKEGRRG